MKTIYSIQLPLWIIPGLTTSDAVPPNYLYRLKDVHKQHLQWSEGDITRQRFKSHDFQLELFECDTRADLKIEVALRKPCMIFYYGLAGHIAYNEKSGNRIAVLTAGQYGVITAPAGDYQMKLPTGRSCALIFILDTDALNNLSKLSSLHLRLGTHFRVFSPYCHIFPFFRIDSIASLYHQFTALQPDRKSRPLKIVLLDLLRDYAKQLDRFNSKPHTDTLKKMLSVKQYINNEVKNGVLPSITQISEEFNTHPDTLSRAFKDEFGTGLKKYINQIKMQQAFQLLSRDKLSILLVSEIMGYNSTSSFSTQFSSYFGFTPGTAAGRNHKL